MPEEKLHPFRYHEKEINGEIYVVDRIYFGEPTGGNGGDWRNNVSLGRVHAYDAPNVGDESMNGDYLSSAYFNVPKGLATKGRNYYELVKASCQCLEL